MVVARGHLGDIVSALPALRDLRRGYPGGRITLVANEYVRGALEGCPFVDEVIYGFGYHPRSRRQTTATRMTLLAQLAGRYDIAIALRASPRSAAVLGLISGAQVRVGYSQPGLAGRLYTRDLGPEPRNQSNRVTNAAAVRALGLPASPTLPPLNWVSDSDRDRADRLLADAGITTGTRFAIFQVAAHWGCYEWQSQKWASLAEHLAGRHDLKVIVVGTGEDFELKKFAEVSRLSQVPISMQGMTTLPMLFHITSRAALVVAPDSALTQVAIAQRVPSVILFGIEPQVRNGPLPEEAGAVMESVQHWDAPGNAPSPNPHCLFGQSHCHTGNCRENSSFERTSAEEVCARADVILERQAVSATRCASRERTAPAVNGTSQAASVR